jgi:hypothetical protein
MGPFARPDLVEMIQDGKLGLQDEVCQATGYWIYLHEHQEVQRQLGVQVPRSAKSAHGGAGEDDEVTETQTEAPLSYELDRGSVPVIPDLPAESDGNTAMFTRRSPSASPSVPAPSSARGVRNPPLLPRHTAHASGSGTADAHSPKVIMLPPPMQIIERSSIWRGFAWILIVASCVIIYAVLRLLRTPH